VAGTPSIPVHGDFSIGRVFARAGAMGRGQWRSMAVIVLLLAVLPSPVRLYAAQQFGLIIQRLFFERTPAPVLPYLPYRLAVLVFHGLGSAALIRLALAHAEGDRTDAASALLQTLRGAPRFILLFLAIDIGGTLLTLLLIVPGMMFEASSWVAMPAAVAEGRGVGRAFQRSFDLTRGARWRLFVIYAACSIGVLLLGQAMVVIRLETAPMVLGWSVVGLVSDALIASVSMVAFSLLHAGAYVELRVWKEGLPRDELRDIFT
jgi:hypothetical protein